MNSKMRIIAFGVRDDEKKFFEEAKEELNVDITECEYALDADTVKQCEGYDAVTTVGMNPIDKVVLDGLKDAGINYLSTRTIGYNNIDIEYAKKIGIRVCNVEYTPDSVANFTVMLMLIALRKYKPAVYRQNVNDYSLEGLMGKNLSSMTVGIIGTGKIGQTVIKNLSGFGCKVYAYDIYQNEEVKKYAEYISLDDIYAKCDLISVHIPLFDSTRHMINDESIAKMKKGVVLINTSRGELMDVKALINAIESEKIGALAMDVFEGENEIYHENRMNDIIANKDMAYLRQFPNVIMTQHMAFYTEASVQGMVLCGIRGLVELKEKGKWKKEI